VGALGLGVFLVGWMAWFPSRELRAAGGISSIERVERRFPLIPWLPAAARTAIAERDRELVDRVAAEVREPWRTELFALLAMARAGERVTVRADGSCRWDDRTVHRIDDWLVGNHFPDAPTLGVDYFRPHLGDDWTSALERSVGERVAHWSVGDAGPGAAPTMTLATDCWLEPRGAVRTRQGWVVAIETFVSFRLEITGRTRVVHSFRIAPPAGATGGDARRWYDRWDEDVRAAFRREVRAVVEVGPSGV
jgi:hypothetical protein